MGSSLANPASTDWASLMHAYGSAEDIPALLRDAESDTRGGHDSNSPWFALWSALFHQGDTYSASYAAVPHLIRIAKLQAFQKSYDPLYLAACIEVSRLEGRGPQLDLDKTPSYGEALLQGQQLAKNALVLPLDEDTKSVYEGCAYAFAGDHQLARAAWDKEDMSAV